MKRLTKKIKGANNYCGYEVKNATYKELFDLNSNKEIEDCVDCDLTIAIDKLGELEDLEEELGCPLGVVAHLVMDKPFYYEDENGDLHKIDCYELCNKGLIFYMSWKDVDIYLGENGDIEIPLSDYKESFWLKEDKSE